MEQTTVDEATDGSVAEYDDGEDAEAIARKTRSDGYVEQDNL